jgi:DNA-binding MarR family transcriptional regulator
MNSLRTNVEDQEWVERLALILDEFRKINQDITANQMLVLLNIGLRPGLTQKELSKVVSLGDSTISRICALLSDRGHQGRVGLGIIDIHEKPGDWRLRGQTLKGNGKRLYASVRAHMTAPLKKLD